MKKIIIVMLSSLCLSHAASAAAISLKSATSDTQFDGRYVIDKKTATSWISTDGKIVGKKIKSMKQAALVSDARIYEGLETLEIKGKAPTLFYFVGIIGPNEHEYGSYIQLDAKTQKEIGHGTYEYETNATA